MRNPPDLLLSAAEAAARVGVSRQRMFQLAQAGEVPFVRTGAGRIYRAADVEDLMARRRASGRRVKPAGP